MSAASVSLKAVLYQFSASNLMYALDAKDDPFGSTEVWNCRAEGSALGQSALLGVWNNIIYIYILYITCI